MRFEAGNQYGKHNNHGRLSKEHTKQLRGLIPDSINAWRKILASDKTDAKWMQLKADVASKIINKFVPELVEETKELVISDRLIDFARVITSRISGLAIGIERPGEAAPDQTGVRPEH